MSVSRNESGGTVVDGKKKKKHWQGFFGGHLTTSTLVPHCGTAAKPQLNGEKEPTSSEWAPVSQQIGGRGCQLCHFHERSNANELYYQKQDFISILAQTNNTKYFFGMPTQLSWAKYRANASIRLMYHFKVR